VNALGDVRDGDGRIVAGARAADGSWLDGAAWLARGGGSTSEFGDLAGRNTTLAVVATNVALDRAALGALARAASAAIYRRITPGATLFDGEVIFATAPVRGGTEGNVAQVEALAVRALETAIERGVRVGAPGDILER
jgi:L-aminopeptidase/D-esterase-like protein